MVAEPLVTRLEAFDKDGIHCGWAELRVYSGKWLTYILGKGNLDWFASEAEAEAFLRQHGAVRVERQEGVR